jgi:two-component system phosphate regulon sensor histidine kinase PhoR
MAPDDLGMRALVDALDEPALIVEGLGVIFANDAAKALLGNAIEGRDVRLAIRHPDVLEHVLTGRPAVVDVTGIGELDRPWRVVVRDLGHGASFVRMIDRAGAVSAEKMRVDFVANASHELRTPLATIIGYAETLVDDDNLSPVLRHKFLQTIREESARMLRLIEDLMSLSRIQADRFVEPAEIVSLEEVLEAAMANVSHLRHASGCEFQTDLPDDMPSVRGDRAQLEQLFDNLLSNAVRYGCAATACTIRIVGSFDAHSVNIAVVDQGPGISREHTPRLTERFDRVDAARSRGSGGTGLGLAIAKHIAERHRGLLQIDSEVGKGTVVTVRLPLVR